MNRLGSSKRREKQKNTSCAHVMWRDTIDVTIVTVCTEQKKACFKGGYVEVMLTKAEPQRRDDDLK